MNIFNQRDRYQTSFNIYDHGRDYLQPFVLGKCRVVKKFYLKGNIEINAVDEMR